VRQRLTPQSKVLDLGCGRGGLVEQLSHPLSQVVGVDPDLLSLQEHRLPLPRLQAISHHLPFHGNSFDLVFASWLLEHLAQPLTDFREISRILRPGGCFIFITPNVRHPLSTLNRILGRVGRVQSLLVSRLYGRDAPDTFPTYYRANDEPQLAQLAQQAGLRLAELHFVADPTYLAFTPTLFRLSTWVDERLATARKLHLVGALAKA
jgi:SAM-dependent methyltransferase